MYTDDENASASFSKKCFWVFCYLIIFTIIAFSSFLMLIGSSLLWNKINSHYFDLADNIEDVICKSCVIVFTLAAAFIILVSTFSIIGTTCCMFCGETQTMYFFFASTSVVILMSSLFLIIPEPIWLSKNMNILTNYEENSRITFQRQLHNKSVMAIWDDYQTDFHCCGYNSYKDYESLFLNVSVPTSCCNRTTIPALNDCLDVVKNVTNKDIQSHKIYTDGCPGVIVSLLNLDSPSVYRIGVSASVFCAFIVIGCLVMLLLTFILLARNKDECQIVGLGMLIGLLACCKAMIESNPSDSFS